MNRKFQRFFFPTFRRVGLWLMGFGELTELGPDYIDLKNPHTDYLVFMAEVRWEGDASSKAGRVRKVKDLNAIAAREARLMEMKTWPRNKVLRPRF